MKIKKENISEVSKIIRGFNLNESKVFNGKSVKLPLGVAKYVEARLTATNNKSKIVSLNNAKFYIELIDDLFYMTRVIDDTERKVILQPEELMFIKDLDNISKKELKALAIYLDRKEGRFGL